jgi:hypothetical protein
VLVSEIQTDAEEAESATLNDGELPLLPNEDPLIAKTTAPVHGTFETGNEFNIGAK